MKKTIVHSPRVRGIVALRADAPQLPVAIDEINRTFASFREKTEERIAELKKGIDDPLTLEPINKMNADISALDKRIAEIQAAAKIGGNPGDDPVKREHSAAFNGFMRKGVDAGLRDLEVKAALTTDKSADGGYLVPTTLDGMIDRVLGTVSAVRGISRVVRIGAGTYKKQVSQGGATSGWVGEKSARPETSTPTLAEIEISPGEIYSNPAATQTLLNDAMFNVESWLAEEVAIEFAEEEGAALISGNGVNRPRGFLTEATVANASYAWGSLGFVVTGGAAAFASSNPADAVINLFYALKQGYRNGASFLTSDAVLGTMRQWKDGQGNYLWAPPTADMPGTILGKPVITDDNMPALAANAFPVAFGDFGRGYTVVDVGSTQILRNPYTNMPYVHFYTTRRVGGKVTNFEAIKLLKCST